MTDTSLASALTLREQFEELRVQLSDSDAHTRRDALKGAIIALYRGIEHELADLATLKEETKGLVQQWKSLDEATAPAAVSLAAPEPAPSPTPARAPAPSPAPAPTPVAPASSQQAAASSHDGQPTRADHLNASTYLEKGWSLISLGDHAGAEAALSRALELAPNDPHGESLLGWAQMLQDKHDDALLNFQKVLMRQPQNSLARINVGYICLKKKIFGEAIEHLSKAIRLDNDRKATLYAHYYLGLLYLEREMYEDAQNFLRKAITLGPNLIEAHYELGRAIFFAGDRDGALDAWRGGARTNKFSPWGKRCAEVLRHVEEGGAPPRSS